MVGNGGRVKEGRDAERGVAGIVVVVVLVGGEVGAVVVVNIFL